MQGPSILHMFTASPNVSPFDVNMAYDAGWQVVVPYTGVGLEQVAALTQDAIFSRGPAGLRRTGIFLGGRDIALAFDMMDAVRRALVPPFEVGVMADPSGAFTSAAALMASVESQLLARFGHGLGGRQVVLLGANGPVGAAAAVVAGGAGARVRMATAKDDPLADAEILVTLPGAAAALVPAARLLACSGLRVAADLNVAAPAAIPGIGPGDCGAPLPGSVSGAVGIGPLFIANVRHQVMRGQLERLRLSDVPLALDFRDAFEYARGLLGRPSPAGTACRVRGSEARPAAA